MGSVKAIGAVVMFVPRMLWMQVYHIVVRLSCFSRYLKQCTYLYQGIVACFYLNISSIKNSYRSTKYLVTVWLVIVDKLFGGMIWRV